MAPDTAATPRLCTDRLCPISPRTGYAPHYHSDGSTTFKDQPENAAFEFNLSTSPVDAMFQDVTLVVGVEGDPGGALRVYLGARYKHVYLLVDDEAAKESVRRGWSYGGHLWLWPIPPADMLHKERVDA